MVEGQAIHRFNETAEKWRDLAEKRRLHLLEMQQSGRWKYYFAETVFLRRLEQAEHLVARWVPVLQREPPKAPKAPKPSAIAVAALRALRRS